MACFCLLQLRRLTEYFGVAVAVAVAGGLFASQHISGGFLNPAAALAVALVDSGGPKIVPPPQPLKFPGTKRKKNPNDQ
eukprot:1618821-Amphidinium_carterae.1